MGDWVQECHKLSQKEDSSTYPKQQKLDRNFLEGDFDSVECLTTEERILALKKVLARKLSGYGVLVFEVNYSCQRGQPIRFDVLTGRADSRVKISTTASVNQHQHSMQIKNQLQCCGVQLQFAPAMRNILFRLLNRLNMDISHSFYYRACPATGSLHQIYCGSMYCSQSSRVRRIYNGFDNWLTQHVFSEVANGLKIFFHDLAYILYMVGLLEERQLAEWPKRPDWRQPNPNQNDTVKEILALLAVCTMPYQLFEKCSQNMWPQQYRQPNIIELRATKLVTYHQNRLQLTRQARMQNPNDKLDIYMTVKVNKFDEVEDELRETSATATLGVFNVQFVYDSLPSVQFTKKLVRKEVAFRSDANQRFKNEIEILKKIAVSPAIYVSKYYYDMTSPNRLLLNYTAQHSLERYAKKYHNILSLITKLYIIYNVVQGLRFLKEKEVVHGDLKAENILLGRGVMPKLKGFGLSAFKGKRPVDCQPDLSSLQTLLRFHSNPPPSTFLALIRSHTNPNDMYSHKQDIYQLGEFIYELIFDRPATEMPQENAERYLAQQWYNPLNLRTLCPEETLRIGPLPYMSILTHITFKCLSRLPEDRPQLEWLAILFKTLMILLIDTIN